MKLFVTLFSVLLAVNAVASDPPEDFSFYIQTDNLGTGHGCAVNGLVLTNAHMVDPRERYDYDVPAAVRFRYEFPSGQTGRGKSFYISGVADLAIIELDQEPPSGYAELGDKPEEGDKIHWLEYDFKKRKNIFDDRWRDAKVIKVIFGDVLLDDHVVRGASGGCAFNEDGKVIGIVTYGRTTGDRKTSTGITGIWGDWWKDVDVPE